MYSIVGLWFDAWKSFFVKNIDDKPQPLAKSQILKETQTTYTVYFSDIKEKLNKTKFKNFSCDDFRKIFVTKDYKTSYNKTSAYTIVTVYKNTDSIYDKNIPGHTLYWSNVALNEEARSSVRAYIISDNNFEYGLHRCAINHCVYALGYMGSDF